jgi:signal peptidase II
LRVLYVTFFAVVLDQVAKIFVKGLKIESLGISIPGMPYGSSKQVFGDFVKLTFIENPGMAFGIDVGPKMFLTIFTIGASLLILYYIFKHRHDGILIRLSLAFILAGALGNLIDRTFYGLIYGYAPLFHGRVVDFVQIEFWDFTFLGKTYTTWPIFNVADVSVTLGFLIILFFHKSIFKEETPEVTGTDGSSLPLDDKDTEHEIQGSGEQNVLNNNGSQISFEDTKGNPAQGTAGTEEAKDR